MKANGGSASSYKKSTEAHPFSCNLNSNVASEEIIRPHITNSQMPFCCTFFFKSLGTWLQLICIALSLSEILSIAELQNDYEDKCHLSLCTHNCVCREMAFFGCTFLSFNLDWNEQIEQTGPDWSYWP